MDGENKMKTLFTVMAMAIALAIPSLVSAQGGAPGVMQMILFDYEGDAASMAENFKARQEVYAEINPEATLRLLYDEIHGAAVGRYRVHIGYPSLGYFAEAQVRERASDEWKALAMGDATTRVYEGLSRVILPPVNTPPEPSGGAPAVVQIILLHHEGDEADLVEDVKKSQAVYAEINPEAGMRLMYDEIHGGAVGRYRIHIYFPSLAYFAAAQGREMASDEWRQLAENRGVSTTRTYEGLSRVVVSSRR
jgi:hypothetical protein